MSFSSILKEKALTLTSNNMITKDEWGCCLWVLHELRIEILKTGTVKHKNILLESVIRVKGENNNRSKIKIQGEDIQTFGYGRHLRVQCHFQTSIKEFFTLSWILDTKIRINWKFLWK